MTCRRPLNVAKKLCRNCTPFQLNSNRTNHNLTTMHRHNFATAAPSSSQSSVNIFDREMKKRHKTTAAQLSNSADYDYFRLEMAHKIINRCLDLEREHPICLDLGCGSGYFYNELCNYIRANPSDKNPGGIKKMFSVDMCDASLFRDEIDRQNKQLLQCHRREANEENLPFDDDTFDIVVTNMSLQWVNDLPKACAEVLRVLKPDGVFLGCFAGSNSLQELRSSFILAEQERRGGMSSHVSPMVHTRDVGSLLGNSGFSLVTVDNEDICIPYPNLFTIMEHLHGSGDQLSTYHRESYVPSDVFIAAASIYDVLYGTYENSTPPIEQQDDTAHDNPSNIDNPSQNKEENSSPETETVEEDNDEEWDFDDDGYVEKNRLVVDSSGITVDATIQAIHFVAWKPHASQQAPMERGADNKGLQGLGDILGATVEIVTGDDTYTQPFVEPPKRTTTRKRTTTPTKDASSSSKDDTSPKDAEIVSDNKSDDSDSSK